jgi:hypothetical protein
MADGRELSVANVHLEAGGNDKNEKQRIAQLASVLKRMDGSIVVCGDFNSCISQGSSLHVQLVDKALVRAPTSGITLAHPGYSDTLDHIWVTQNLVARLVLGSSKEALAAVEIAGIPNATHPSDHLPVAATFSFKPPASMKQQNQSLPVMPSAISAEISQEWLQICRHVDVNGGKRALREQKRLEAAFLEILSEEEASQLLNWRDTAARAARNVVVAAAEGAIQNLMIMQAAPVTMSKTFDPGGGNCSMTNFLRPTAERAEHALSLGGA